MSSHSSSVKSPWVDLQVVDMEPSAFPISQAYGIWQPDGWQLCHSSGYIFTTASNTLRAVAFDLKAFFSVVEKDPEDVRAADIFEFLAHQRGDRSVVRLADRESGLSARTIARRLASISGLYSYLVARGDTSVRTNPVPRGLSTRRSGGSARTRTVPLVRVPRTLPKILEQSEVDRLLGSLRTHRDRSMVEAMVLGGLRRCEVLGLRFSDLDIAERKVFVAEGKGGHHRVVPISHRFFASIGGYLDAERPNTDTDRLFVVLKGPK